MKICIGKLEHFSKCGVLTSEQVCLVVGDAADIFHSAAYVLWDEDLIILSEGVFSAKELLIEGDSCLCCREHLFMSYVFDK